MMEIVDITFAKSEYGQVLDLVHTRNIKDILWLITNDLNDFVN